MVKVMDSEVESGDERIMWYRREELQGRREGKRGQFRKKEGRRWLSFRDLDSFRATSFLLQTSREEQAHAMTLLELPCISL